MKKTDSEKPFIRRLSKKAWSGIDVSCDVSLFEYNMIWKVKGKDLMFINKQSHSKNFECSFFPLNVNLKQEFNWINWECFLSYVGDKTFEKWNELSLGRKIFDLTNYYGIENIFGTSYVQGFQVKFI